MLTHTGGQPLRPISADRWRGDHELIFFNARKTAPAACPVTIAVTVVVEPLATKTIVIMPQCQTAHLIAAHAINARRIINGNDCDDIIAAYHDKFLAALERARLDE